MIFTLYLSAVVLGVIDRHLCDVRSGHLVENKAANNNRHASHRSPDSFGRCLRLRLERLPDCHTLCYKSRCERRNIDDQERVGAAMLMPQRRDGPLQRESLL
jgi:hypothetical protein